MIDEMAFDAVTPGGMPNFLAGFAAHVVPLVSRFGTLTGAWTADFGPVNHVVSLWRYQGLAEREEASAEWRCLSANPRHQVGRTVELLHPARPAGAQDQPGKLYELRIYGVAPGRADDFVRNMIDILPVREKYNRNLGVWSPRAGDLDRAFHLWLYDDLAHRAATRVACAQHPAWQSYLERNVPLTRHRASSLLVPTAFSPMR
jgi:hypothetical protein